MQLFLLPLYTRQEDPVEPACVEAAAEALRRIYTVKVIVGPPERYDGRTDTEAMLEYVGQRPELTMAVIGMRLQASSNGRSWPMGRELSGIGDLPNDSRERPRGSVITTRELVGRPERDIERWLGIVAIHEFGHNLGAWDCNDRTCFMHYAIEVAHGPVPRRFCPFHDDLLSRALRRG